MYFFILIIQYLLCINEKNLHNKIKISKYRYFDNRENDCNLMTKSRHLLFPYRICMQTFAPKKSHGFGFCLGTACTTQQIDRYPRIQPKPKTVGLLGANVCMHAILFEQKKHQQCNKMFQHKNSKNFLESFNKKIFLANSENLVGKRSFNRLRSS